jgi:hypothetical protein
MDLLGSILLDNRKKFKATVLYRKGGFWSREEIVRVVDALHNEISQHPQHPEYAIINGHYPEDVIKKAVGSNDFTVTQNVGVDNLPWRCFVV